MLHQFARLLEQIAASIRGYRAHDSAAKRSGYFPNFGGEKLCGRRRCFLIHRMLPPSRMTGATGLIVRPAKSVRPPAVPSLVLCLGSDWTTGPAPRSDRSQPLGNAI